MIIDVEFNQKKKRLQYQTGTVAQFIERLRSEFNINAGTDLDLFDGDIELSKGDTLINLGVQDRSVLILKSEEATCSIKCQNIEGKVLEFTVKKSTTLRELQEKIKEEVKSASTFPLLFNHRMHLFETDQFFQEPIGNILDLHKFSDKNTPHFYIFNFDLQHKPTSYNYNRIYFTFDDLWQPKSQNQSSESMMIFLGSIFALRSVFSNVKDADFDDLHNLYLPQFLIVLRQYLFPPACLAFKHVIEGSAFDFEKQLLSESFYQLIDRLIPETIPKSELFSYMPYLFCWIFNQKDQTSHQNAGFEEIMLKQENKNNQISESYLLNPVRLLTNKLVKDASGKFVLAEYDDVKTNTNLTEEDYQRQADLAGLFIYLDHFRQKNGWNDPGKEKNFFEKFSCYYTIWIPGEDINLQDVGDVYQQKKNIDRLTGTQVESIREGIETNASYSIFTFADPNKLSNTNEAQFILLQSNKIVYITSKPSCSDAAFNCLDPTNTIHEFTKDQVASIDEVKKRHQYVIRESIADNRLIEQVTFVLFDVSGSMENTVSPDQDGKNLLELSSTALVAWRDRLRSYRLSHAVGLVYFGTQDLGDLILNMFTRSLGNIVPSQNDQTDMIIGCPLTRKFADFEEALKKQPPCGCATNLYDAIDVAMENIIKFCQENKLKLSNDHKKLILCLTDGQDNCSKMKQSDILEKLIKSNTTIDVINFMKESDHAMVELCEKTKGYYYINVPHTQDKLLNLFELEAAISVRDRAENVFGRIGMPERRKPKDLTKPAIAAKQAPVGAANSASIRLKRIMLEIKHFNKQDKDNLFELFISKENIGFWKIIMRGPIGTLYSDGLWLISIEFPDHYPQQAPEVRFVTKIYHCNVNDDGKICDDILTSAWSEKTSVHSVMLEIIRLLREPNASDALSAVKGAQMNASPADYDKMIVEWKKLYASASVEELKRQYALE